MPCGCAGDVLADRLGIGFPGSPRCRLDDLHSQRPRHHRLDRAQSRQAGLARSLGAPEGTVDVSPRPEFCEEARHRRRPYGLVAATKLDAVGEDAEAPAYADGTLTNLVPLATSRDEDVEQPGTVASVELPLPHPVASTRAPEGRPALLRKCVPLGARGRGRNHVDPFVRGIAPIHSHDCACSGRASGQVRRTERPSRATGGEDFQLDADAARGGRYRKAVFQGGPQLPRTSTILVATSLLA